MTLGLEVTGGENLKFLFTSAENRRYERRVKAEELIEKDTNPDIKKYLILLYAAAAGLPSPLNYTTNRVYDAVRGHRQTTLAYNTNMPNALSPFGHSLFYSNKCENLIECCS